jgi:DNA repair protein RecO
MSYKTEAIILNSRDVNEFDRIYDIFSCDFGKTSVLAKGVRKPTAKLSSGLEPLTHSEIFLIKGRSLDRVIGVIIHDQYIRIKSDLDRIKFVKSIFSIFKHSFLESSNQQQEIFNLITEFLAEMSIQKLDWERMRLMRMYLIWKIMYLFGNQPELFCCSGCQKKFSLEDHNFWFCSSLETYCNSCGANANIKKIKIDQTVIKILRLVIKKNWNIVQKVLVKEGELNQLEKITQLALENILSSQVFF